MPTPSLRQIEAFKAFVEAGTVAQSARTLGITPRVARSLLRQMESQTGLQLFERSRGRVTPTAEALQLYQEVATAFAALDRIAETAERLRSGKVGRLAIGVMPGLATGLLGDTAQGFHASHPDVRLCFTLLHSQAIAEGLISGRFDLGLISRVLDHPQFTVSVLDSRPMVCILPAYHPLAERRQVTLAEIAEQPMIALAAENETRRRLESVLAASMLKPKIVMETNTTQSACELVAAGLGLAVVAPSLAEGYRPQIISKPLAPSIHLDIFAVRPCKGRNAGLVEAFIQCLSPRRAQPKARLRRTLG